MTTYLGGDPTSRDEHVVPKKTPQEEEKTHNKDPLGEMEVAQNQKRQKKKNSREGHAKNTL